MVCIKTADTFRPSDGMILHKIREERHFGPPPPLDRFTLYEYQAVYWGQVNGNVTCRKFLALLSDGVFGRDNACPYRKPRLPVIPTSYDKWSFQNNRL